MTESLNNDGEAKLPVEAVKPLSAEEDELFERIRSARFDDNGVTASENLRLSMALDSGDVGVWAWEDMSTPVSYWSEKYYRLLGYEPGEIASSINAFESEVLHPKDLRRTREAVYALFEDGTRFNLEYQLRTKSGKYRWFRGTAVLARNRDGSAKSMVGSIQDIHEAKLAQDEIALREKRYRALVESINSIVCIADANRHFSSIQRSWNLMTGQGWPEQRGLGWAEMICETDRDKFVETWHRRATEGFLRYEETVKVWSTEHSEYRHCSFRAVSILDDASNVIEWVINVADVHDVEIKRIILEESRVALERANAQLDALFQNAPFSAFLKDKDLRYLRVNQAYLDEFCPLFGGERDIIGRHQGEVAPPELMSVVGKRDLSVIRSGKAESFEDTFEFPDGTMRTYMLNLYPVVDVDGEVLGLGGLAADISERARMEIKLRERTRDLERSNAELDRFAQIASHDLREPLRMVTINLEALAEDLPPEVALEVSALMTFAKKGAKRMKQLVTDLLEMSQVTSNAKPFEVANLESVTADTLEAIGQAIRDSNAKITVGQLPVKLSCDGTQLGVVFQNLILNSIRYASPNRAPEIHINATEAPERWTFCVEDNGRGIPEDQFENVFEVFQRLHSRDEIEGTGIGLSVCKRIVERHLGAISVASTVGEGARFSFTVDKRLEQPR